MKVIWTIDPETRVITVEPVEGFTVEVGQREVTEAHSSIILDDLQHRLSGEALEMANYKRDAQ
jgi:hypothetical protein